MNMHDHVLALAGVFQAAALAHSSAFKGNADPLGLQTSVESIYVLDPPSAEGVYGDTRGLRIGFKTLLAQLGGARHDQQLLRYAIAMLQIAQRLARRPDLSLILRQRLPEIQHKAEQLGPIDDAILERLGALYLTTMSTMKPRVVVNGQPQYLKQDRIVSRIRAILLAGVRSAVLWEQLGGKRRWLLLKRKLILAEAHRFLQSAA